MSESKSNEILIGDDENESLFTEFIKFLYTGGVDTSDQQKLVEFMIVANKYLVKNMKDFKVSAKILLEGIISYIDKDVDGRLSEFDNLCESVDFKKLEKEELLKLYTKKNGYKEVQLSYQLLF